jgi:glycosyltransferase involved in cell wall biosynthesis
LNSTESFGLVQIEAIMHGLPVAASDLPGVRQPELNHHLGKIFPVGDAAGLAESVIEILRNRGSFNTDAQAIRDHYLPDAVAAAYEQLFLDIAAEVQPEKKRSMTKPPES